MHTPQKETKVNSSLYSALEYIAEDLLTKILDF